MKRNCSSGCHATPYMDLLLKMSVFSSSDQSEEKQHHHHFFHMCQNLYGRKNETIDLTPSIFFVAMTHFCGQAEKTTRDECVRQLRQNLERQFSCQKSYWLHFCVASSSHEVCFHTRHALIKTVSLPAPKS